MIYSVLYFSSKNNWIQDLFDLFSKQTSMIDILLGEIRSSVEEKIRYMCVCVCGGGGGGGGATCNYIL